MKEPAPAAGDDVTRAKAPRGLEIVEHGGYPELRVDGKPFFIHSAAFFYYRIPRDLWEPMLDRYRSLGINTLDIYIPWNWHEPNEGEFDFDGHTNPRRDLRTLLSLIARKQFKLIARPGPEILNEWRHGGFPDWLLKKPEYNMDPLDFVEGRYAPLDNLNAHDAEAAAHGWLENSTHIEAVRSWFGAVAKELAPYDSREIIHRKAEVSSQPTATEESGPLLFVQVGDDFAIGRTNREGPEFWRYVEALRSMLASGGLKAPVFINPTDMRVSAAGEAQNPPTGAMGQWYMRPRETADPAGPALSAEEAGEIEFFTEELKTQPNFPPVLIEYQAGWYAPADDDRPKPDSAANTLLSSRLLIANGLHGFNYFPLQDTYTPAGYSVPWANRSYRWDAALGPDGNSQSRLAAVRRNAALLKEWGPMLAASHKRADFGIIYALGAYPQDQLTAADIRSISEPVMRIERLGLLAAMSSELLDPEYQPVAQLLRDPVVFLPSPDSGKAEFEMSDRAQRAIVDYVRRGGTLVAFPVRPEGKIIGELWEKAPEKGAVAAESAISRRWKFGEGEVVESSKDFLSWLSLEQSLGENRAQPAAKWAAGVLNEFIAAGHVRPSVRISGDPEMAPELIVSEIVTNEGTELLGERKNGRGFLSLTNLAVAKPAEADLKVLSPAASARGTRNDYLPLHVVVPPRDSLLLPLEMPICFPEREAACDEEIATAGAEFLGAQRDGKTLELTFYVPSKADFRIHLAEKPSHLTLDEMDTKPDSTWETGSKDLVLTIPRGAAPDFRRTLKIDERHAKVLAEREQSHSNKAPAEDVDCYVQNAVLFPASGNQFLRTSPAIVLPDQHGKTRLVLIAENRNESASANVELAFDKVLHGTKNLVVPPRGVISDILDFRQPDQAGDAPQAPDHLFHSAVEVHVGQDRRVLPIAFLLHTAGTEDHYRFDFDRDGADEWVLENDRLRLIVSPESGGRALALMDKSTGANLSTSVGLLRDNFSFTENPAGINPARVRGKYGLFNRAYRAAWGGDAANTILNLDYDAPDVYPVGATIEKSIRLEEPDAVRVDYRVSLHAGGAQPDSNVRAQSFVAVNSFSADGEPVAPTRFCWQKPSGGNATPSATAKDAQADAKPGSDADEDCEDFVREGKPIEVPDGVSTIQIRTVRQPVMELNWDCAGPCGRMTIQQKYFSALFLLEFPSLTPGAEAAKYSMRIRVLNSP